jgi:hypothetical protein
MLRISALNRMSKKQRTIYFETDVSVEPARSVVSTLSHLDEILTEYEDHDWCDYPDYKRYYRAFRQNVKCLMALSRCSAFILDKR